MHMKLVGNVELLIKGICKYRIICVKTDNLSALKIIHFVVDFVALF